MTSPFFRGQLPMICSLVKTVLPVTVTSPNLWMTPSFTGMTIFTRGFFAVPAVMICGSPNATRW
jgi:hypothetical protein